MRREPHHRQTHLPGKGMQSGQGTTLPTHHPMARSLQGGWPPGQSLRLPGEKGGEGGGQRFVREPKVDRRTSADREHCQLRYAGAAAQLCNSERCGGGSTTDGQRDGSGASDYAGTEKDRDQGQHNFPSGVPFHKRQRGIKGLHGSIKNQQETGDLEDGPSRRGGGLRPGPTKNPQGTASERLTSAIKIRKRRDPHDQHIRLTGLRS